MCCLTLQDKTDYTASYPEDRASFLSVQMPQNQNLEQ
jgi:hypothetical protein